MRICERFKTLNDWVAEETFFAAAVPLVAVTPQTPVPMMFSFLSASMKQDVIEVAVTE